MIDELKPYLKEGVDEKGLEGVISKLTKGTAEPADPLKGLNNTNAFDYILSNAVLKSAHDRAITEAVKNNWKDKFDEKYNERYNAEHPPESDIEKKLREIEQKYEASERREKQKNLEVLAFKTATDLNIPKVGLSIVTHLIGEDEETTTANIKALAAWAESIAKEVKGEVLSNNNINVETGGGEPPDQREKRQKSYNEAVASGDWTTAIKLARPK
jgi:hypothetical protein